MVIEGFIFINKYAHNCLPALPSAEASCCTNYSTCTDWTSQRANTEYIFPWWITSKTRIHNDSMKQHGSRRFSTRNSAYLVVCSSGGVPATSVLGSEVVLSTVAPADPGDPAGEVAAVCMYVCVGEGGGGQSDTTNDTKICCCLTHGWLSTCF